MTTLRPAPARLPLSRVAVRPALRSPDAWFWALPAIAQLRTDGLELAPVTLLVGENGSGLELQGEHPHPQDGAFLRAEEVHGHVSSHHLLHD